MSCASQLECVFSINCRDAVNPKCPYIFTGSTERELFENAKNHVIKEHGMTADQFEDHVIKNGEKYLKLIKEL